MLIRIDPSGKKEKHVDLSHPNLEEGRTLSSSVWHVSSYVPGITHESKQAVRKYFVILFDNQEK